MGSRLLLFRILLTQATLLTSVLTATLPQEKIPNTEVNVTQSLDRKCFTTEEAADFCSSINEGNSASSAENKEEEKQPKDVSDLLAEWSSRAVTSKSDDDWRSGTASELNRHLLKEELFTDCSFVVGPEERKQTVRAHKVLLQRASPVFEAMFNSTRGRPIRVPDISPDAFRTLLEFVYTGDICMNDFDVACELVGVSSRVGLPTLGQHSRAFLWTSLYPANVWRAYRCAAAANDKRMMELALQVAKRRTDEALMDQTFSEIPLETLISFLKQDELNVKSELQLFDASVRWALSESTRRNLSQTPENLRTVLGPALNLIRFLTLTPREFADNQLTSQVLTCGERLAIMYNLNSPGIMPIPETISSNKVTRKLSKGQSYIDVIVSEKGDNTEMCKNETQEIVKNAILPKNSFDLFSTNMKSFSSSKSIRAINIPSQVKLNPDGSTNTSRTENYLEDVTVYVVNSKNMVQSVTKHQARVQYNSLVFIKLSESVTLNSCSSETTCQQIRIKFHIPGRYPTTYSSVKNAGTSDYEYFSNIGRSFVYYLGEKEYIYSVVMTS